MTIEEKVEQDLRNLVGWRFDQLVNAGSDNHNAQLISERTDISLHDALDLLAHDCPPRLMVVILL